MEEIWKDIVGYEGLYQASNLGRIRTCEGKTTYTKRHGIRRWKQRIMLGRGNNLITGKRVSLWKNGTFKEFLVARLVAFAFYGKDINDKNVENRRDLMTVNHIDGDRMNNVLSNLEIIPLKENITFGFDNGQYRKNQISITLTDKRTNTKLYFASMSEAERKLGLCHGYFSHLKSVKKPYHRNWEISFGSCKPTGV